MKIRRLQRDEVGDFDILARKYGTLFNCSDWLNLFGDKIQLLGIFDDGGQMIGGLSLYQEHRWGLKILRSAPFTPTCGPFLEVKAQNPVAILEARRKVLVCLAEYLEKQSASIVMFSLDQKIIDALPFFWQKYKVVPHYTYLINLLTSIPNIQKNMSSATRNHISKARKDGLIVRRTNDMSIVRDLVLSTFARQNKSLNIHILEAILFRYANASNSYAFTTYREDRPIATCFVVYNNTIAYNLLAGSKTEERHHGAGPLAVFEAIKYAQGLGVQVFDFEGSVIPAIETYFRGFGGELTPYFTVNKAWLPLEIALKFVKRGVF